MRKIIKANSEVTQVPELVQDAKTDIITVFPVFRKLETWKI